MPVLLDHLATAGPGDIRVASSIILARRCSGNNSIGRESIFEVQVSGTLHAVQRCSSKTANARA
jgi:hypothetical protein